AREMPCGQDRETARAGAEVEHASDLRGLADQRGVRAAEMRVQQFADEGTRYDHALVDIERQAAHVGLVDEIGGGLARGDAAAQPGEGGPWLGPREPRT